MKIFKYISAAYLGFALSYFANVSWNNWQFYAIVVPFFIFERINNFNKDEE